MPHRIAVAVLGALFGLLSSFSFASVIALSNGTAANANVRDCRSSTALATPDKCQSDISVDPVNWFGTLVEQVQSVDPGGAGSTVFSTNSLGILGSKKTGGTVLASAPGTFSPEAQIGAFTSASYARSTVFVTAIQGYRWDGSGTSQRTFTLTMDYTSTFPGDFPLADTMPDTASGGEFGIVIFSLSTPTFEANDDPTTFVSGCYIAAFDPSLCLGNLADFNLLGTAQASTDSSGLSPLLTSVNFDLVPGQFIFVEFFANAVSRFGAEFETTITSKFSSTEGLTVLQAVPEPSSGLLMIMALWSLYANLPRRRLKA